MTTNITIRVSQTPTRRRTPRRHVTIPHTALFTQDWWDAQSDPSASVRELISADVLANGMTDVMGRLAVPAATPSGHLGSPFTAPMPSTTAPAAPAAAPAAAPTLAQAAAQPTAPAPVAPVAQAAAAPAASSPIDPAADAADLREEMAVVRELINTLLPLLQGALVQVP